jgi:hypothetical protein
LIDYHPRPSEIGPPQSFLFCKKNVFWKILVLDPDIYISNIEHMLGALNDTPFLITTKLSSVVFLWGNKNHKIKSSRPPHIFGDPG